MDFSRYTNAQLHTMHQTAGDDANRAIRLAEAKSLELSDLSRVPTNDAAARFAAVHAEFLVLMAQADEYGAEARAIYNEIARRASLPVLGDWARAGGVTRNGTRYCRTCGFADCPSLTEGGDCPRWPAREDTCSDHDGEIAEYGSCDTCGMFADQDQAARDA